LLTEITITFKIVGNYKKSIFIINVHIIHLYKRTYYHKNCDKIQNAFTRLLRISCTKLYYEFPVRKGEKVHTKVGNKGWKAEKRSDWQKECSKSSKKLTAFSLHVNDGKRLVTRGSRDDPERKRIMTPVYLRNTRPVHPSWCATERLPILTRRAISPPSANRGSRTVAKYLIICCWWRTSQGRENRGHRA